MTEVLVVFLLLLLLSIFLYLWMIFLEDLGVFVERRDASSLCYQNFPQ